MNFQVSCAKKNPVNKGVGQEGEKFNVAKANNIVVTIVNIPVPGMMFHTDHLRRQHTNNMLHFEF